MTVENDDLTTVFVDADNTLWDTDGVFAGAQRTMLADVMDELGVGETPADPLAFVRMFDQAIAVRHQDGLRYPPVLLVRALEKGLAGVPAEAAARAAQRGRHEYRIAPEAAEGIAASFVAALGSTPKLRSGVRDGLAALRRTGVRLVLISEGSKARVEATATRHGILDVFEQVVEGRKDVALYRRMLALSRTGARSFMVGDQLDRDIEPASSVGLETIHFPGGFQPRWNEGRRGTAPDHQVDDFVQVASIVKASVARAAASA